MVTELDPWLCYATFRILKLMWHALHLL